MKQGLRFALAGTILAAAVITALPQKAQYTPRQVEEQVLLELLHICTACVRTRLLVK